MGGVVVGAVMVSASVLLALLGPQPRTTHSAVMETNDGRRVTHVVAMGNSVYACYVGDEFVGQVSAASDLAFTTSAGFGIPVFSMATLHDGLSQQRHHISEVG